MRISVFFVGEIHDNGFNASALAGVEAAQSNQGKDIKVVSGIPYDEHIMAAELASTAEQSDVVLFIGGQGDKVMPEIAHQYPNKRFAVIQGSVVGENLFSYEVKQEESAFLAGVLAAHWTKTGIIGHLSGHRVKPGLKGRAAYVAGAKYANKNISILTSFCGTQDDGSITQAWAEAQISDGADIIFTMLNGARAGAIEACRSNGVLQIGNAMDWCEKVPDVFVASAIARIDAAVLKAISDAEENVVPLEKVEIGLKEGDAVMLSLRADVDSSIRAILSNVEQMLKNSNYEIPDSYEGPEFNAAVIA